MKRYLWHLIGRTWRQQIEDIKPRSLNRVINEMTKSGWRETGDGFAPEGEILLFDREFCGRAEIARYQKKFDFGDIEII